MFLLIMLLADVRLCQILTASTWVLLTTPARSRAGRAVDISLGTGKGTVQGQEGDIGL